MKERQGRAGGAVHGDQTIVRGGRTGGRKGVELLEDHAQWRSWLQRGRRAAGEGGCGGAGTEGRVGVAVEGVEGGWHKRHAEAEAFLVLLARLELEASLGERGATSGGAWECL